MFRIFLLVALILPIEIFAQGSRSIKVKESNIQLFRQLSPTQSYTCYSYRGGFLLGTIKPTPLRIGVRWKDVELNRQIRDLNKVNREILKLEKRNRTNTRSYLKLKLKQQALSLKISNLNNLLSQCSPVPPPTPTPTPTLTPQPTPPPVGELGGDPNSLQPYREALTEGEIKHLLNKVALGGSSELYRIGKEQGLTPLVNALVDGFDDSTAIAECQFWRRYGLYYEEELPNRPIDTTSAAQVEQTCLSIYSKNPFHQKMMMILNNHYAINLDSIGFSYSSYNHEGIKEHVDLLKNHLTGNLISLAREMVSDSAMSAWLNNDDNTKDSPNQNWAREFLELFVLGAYDKITETPNYNQDSVIASTAYFSGFYENSKRDSYNQEVRAVRYSNDLHDFSSYTVFPEFPAATFTGNMEHNAFPEHVIKNHPGSARYLGERFFAQLVSPYTNEIQVSVLSEILKNNNFELKPFLKTILKSSAMFSNATRNVCVTSPLDHTMNILRTINHPLKRGTEEDNQGNFWFLYQLAEDMKKMGQVYFALPSVFGTKGECGINRGGQTATGEVYLAAQKLLERNRSCADIMNLMINNDFDFRTLAAASPDRESLINHIAKTFFKHQLTVAEKEILIRFLSTYIEYDGTVSDLDYLPNEEWYANKKITRLICMIGQTVDLNLK